MKRDSSFPSMLKKISQASSRLIGFESLGIVLIAFVVIQPLVEESLLGWNMLISLFLLFLYVISTFLTTSTFIRGVILLLGFTAITTQIAPFGQVAKDMSIFFQGLVVASILGLVIDDIFFGIRTVREKVYASISGFFLIAILGAYVYMVILLVDPYAISGPEADVFDFSTLLYFSVTTLTTLGYGDIVPLSSSARMATMLQAITGQLYVVIMISRFISQVKARRKKDEAGIIKNILKRGK